MASGPLAERLGYKGFFVFVLLASIPSVIAAWFAPFPQSAQSSEAAAALQENARAH
jgi:PAT family beta-lactamase induction signal transducer AmpG